MIGILSNYFFNWSYLLLAGYRLSSWQNCDDGVHNAYRMLHLPFHHLSTPSPHLLCSPSSFCSTFLPVSHSLHLPFSPSLSIDFSSAFPPGRRPGPYGFRLVDRAYSSERPEADFPRLPSALCPMPHALCALPTFSSSHLLSFLPSTFRSFFIFSHSKFDVGRSMFDVHLLSTFRIPTSHFHFSPPLN